DDLVTGVQTCALPIYTGALCTPPTVPPPGAAPLGMSMGPPAPGGTHEEAVSHVVWGACACARPLPGHGPDAAAPLPRPGNGHARSEERRVGRGAGPGR